MIREDANSISVEGWKGLAIDLLSPEPETCRDGQNFILDEVPGELTLRKGTAPIYALGPEPHSAHVVAGVDINPFNAKARRDQYAMVALDAVWVPQQGGKFIRVALMKYRFRQLATGEAYIYTYGIFARPYWDGAAWVDAWRELTEFWDFEIYEIQGANNEWLLLDPNVFTWDFGNNNGSPVFPKLVANGGTGAENLYYFRGWTVENLEAAQQYKRFGRVLEAQLYPAALLQFAIKLPSDTGNSAAGRQGWQVGDKIRLHRSYIHQANRFSAANDIVCSPTLHRTEDGLRISNGIGTNKARLRVNYEEHGLTGTVTKEHVANGLVAADQCVDFLPASVFVGVFRDASAGAMPAGTYYLRFSVREGKNWSRLFICPNVGVGSVNTVGTGAVTLLNPNERIACWPTFHTGPLSRMFNAIRVYLSTDNQFFYLMKEVTVAALPGMTVETGLGDYIDAAAQTWKMEGVRGEFFIDDAEYSNPGTEASADIGRGIDDDGVFHYTVAQAIGNRLMYADILIDAVRYTNRLYLSAISGDGAQQTDMVPNNPLHYIAIDQVSGTFIRALAGLTDRALVLTETSMVLITMLGALTEWRKDHLTSDDGIAARAGLVVIDNRMYWPGNSAVWTFSLSGGRAILNPDWQETYRAIADKSTALAGFDKTRGRYILHVGGTTYFFPTRSVKVPVTDGMIQDFSSDPSWFSLAPEDYVAYLAANGTLQLAGVATRDGATNITVEFESNVFWVADPLHFDMLVHGFMLDYESNVPVIVDWYRDEEAAVFDTKTLAAGNTREKRLLKLGFSCKGFRVKFRATTSADAQSIRIQQLVVFRTVQAAGGDKSGWV